jgi:gluconate kinase
MSHFEPNERLKLFIIFGRPGAGKTTVSNIAFERLTKPRSAVEGAKDLSTKADENPTIGQQLIRLDLDCFIPQWMKDNFSQGIYPTLQERQEFANSACDLVRQHCEKMRVSCALISFSFVNTDIREVFRKAFPSSTWILMDTDEETAQQRIKQRKDHFFKGKRPVGATSATLSEVIAGSSSSPNVENTEWDFAPVIFDHIVLNGKDNVETNASKIACLAERHFCGS